MNLPLLTIRRMMLLVALVAVALGVAGWMQRRTVEFKDRAIDHGLQWSVNTNAGLDDAHSEWHRAMWGKYMNAARQPWLPVAADPAEPE